MKKFFPLLIAALVAKGLMAQSHVEAKNLLQEATTKMKSYPAMEISYRFNLENKRVDPPILQILEGTVAIQGDNYRLKMDEMEQIRIGKVLYTILHEDEEVQKSEYDEEDAGFSPSSLLTFYEKGYSYKMGGSEVIDGRKIVYVILKPNASEEIDKIMVGIDSKTKEVYSMKQWGTNGTVTTLTVLNLNKNVKWPANYFSFSKADFPDYYME